MNSRELFQSGRLDEAIASLGAELRSDPTDVQRRTFLFELLAFAGLHDRAEKQLDVLAQNGPQAQLGSLMYRSALHAERVRQDMFARADFPTTTPPGPVSGTLNGRPFASLEDADPRIGARLEVYAGGGYLWFPLEHLASLRMERPTRLRDLLWAPAMLQAGPGFRDVDLGEVLLPALTPTASGHQDPLVKLGRLTVWEDDADGAQLPVGQKLLLVDGEEFPLLEVRELVVTPPHDNA